MKKIEQFIGCYSLAKTLSFRLVPVGKTADNLAKRRLVEHDEERAENMKVIKGLIDECHKNFINDVLHNVRLEGVKEYAELFSVKRDNEGEKQLETIEKSLRKQISDAFNKEPRIKTIFEKGIVDEMLPAELDKRAKAGEDVSKELAIVRSFKGFYTALTDFQESRKRLYTDKPQAGTIAHRCIDENLIKFLYNVSCYRKCASSLEASKIRILEKDVLGGDYRIEDVFSTDFFDFVLPQDGIDTYNAVIGGYVKEDGEKVQGLNELVNLHNQRLEKGEGRLPLFKSLDKQILSEGESLSFYNKGYVTDNEVFDDLSAVIGTDSEVYRSLDRLKSLFENLSAYEPYGIYIKNNMALTMVSNAVYGAWHVVQDKWNSLYDEKRKKKVVNDRYLEQRSKAYRSNKSFSLGYIDENVDRPDMPLRKAIRGIIFNEILAVKETYADFNTLLSKGVTGRGLRNDQRAVEIIKSTLDSYKELENWVKAFGGTGREFGRDEDFYREYEECLSCLRQIDRLYDGVRNYVTKKPYSKDKIRLFFDKPTLLGGWSVNNEAQNAGILLKHDNDYFVGIADPSSTKLFKKFPLCDVHIDHYDKVVYNQIPNAAKYLSKKNILPTNPSARIKELLAKKEKATLSPEEVTEFIRYLRDDFLINYKGMFNEEGDRWYDFHLKEPEEYQSLKEFYNDVDDQGYYLATKCVSKEYIDGLVERGCMYLFKIDNQDFRAASHGVPNLHTIYFKSLFDKANDGVIRLSGGAEMFFRKASLKKEEVAVHPANKPMQNKNPLNPNKTRTLTYTLWKDKRYTEDQYEIHIAISINKCADSRGLNLEVRKHLKEDDNPYIIGINRGERNLIYAVVIDGDGKIVESRSFNTIVATAGNGMRTVTDYDKLLEARSGERDSARKNWKSISNIKDLKSGYVSQVVHEVCELVEKYDAVVAIEDLTSEFKNGRARVEKSVYQTFEKMLIDKLNYMVDKKTRPTDAGGAYRGYQLANRFESFSKMTSQNGFMFYVPAWFVGNIDPTTGFVNLLRPQYTTMEGVREWIRLFDRISYNASAGYFEFDIDYDKFPGGEADHVKKWTVCSFGPRVRSFRNADTGVWEWENMADVTEVFKELFDRYKIDYADGDLRDAICGVTEAAFYKTLIEDIRLMLQMRNYEPGKRDYFISPVKNKDGRFFTTEDRCPGLPETGDANDAYNIARKALWAIRRFREADEQELGKVNTYIKKSEWLEFTQTF